MFEGWNIPRKERRWFSFPPGDAPTKQAPAKPLLPPQRCEIMPSGWRRGFKSQAERDAYVLLHFHPSGERYDPAYRESQIFQKTNWRCAYCADKPATTIDHIKATSRGGSNSRDNLIGACHACNAEKANLLLEDFRARRGVTEFPFESYARNTNAAA